MSKKDSILALIATAVFFGLVLLFARVGQASESTGCAEVCASVCRDALVDSCQDFVCPEIPACPDLVCPNPRVCPAPTICPSVKEIVNHFIERKVGNIYTICKVKKNGVQVCKKWRILDAQRKLED